MPSLGEIFKIADLPHTSSQFENNVKSFCSGPSHLTLGISGSSVSTYTLRPSPQLIWSNSLSPSTQIDYIHKLDGQVVFATTERKKHYVTCCSTHDDALTSKTEVESRVVAMYKSPREDCLYLVLVDGRIQCMRGEENLWTRNMNKCVTKFAEFSQLKGFDGEVLVMVTNQPTQKGALLQVLVLSKEKAEEATVVLSKSISKSDGIFAYKSGYLYQYFNETIEITDVTTMETVKTAVVESQGTVESMLGVDDNTVLLSSDSGMQLINTKFTTTTASTVNKALLIAFHSELKLAIVLQKEKRSSSISGIIVDPGKGTLLESVGLGPLSQSKEYGMADIVIKQQYGLTRDYNEILDNVYTTSKNVLGEKLEELRTYKSQNAASKFDNKFVGFMKGQEWDDIDGNTKVDDTLVYEESDRNVDHEFVVEVSSILLDSGTELEFVPMGSLIYLLTHPLFSPNELEYPLVDILKPHPRLLRQAVVTAPTLDCIELIKVLDTTYDDEIFRDAVTRITDEFGREAIINSVQEYYVEAGVDKVVNCVLHLLKLNIGWRLISLFLDAGGLFGWSNGKIVDQLTANVDKQVQSTQSTHEVLTLLDEALRKFDTGTDISGMASLSKRELKRLGKKTKKQQGLGKDDGPQLVTEEQRGKQSMLALGTPAKQPHGADGNTHAAAIRQAQYVSRKMPVYSVEKLIL